ncbi:non-ribosomal peptide synthase/polyketide synthase [Paenibacillus oenotherae]|uniref:Non-ribosomal peptide synthase/polyketide synthase n=1 Tax=Paenibacillus oenotherae TaxID=1435645 RepID=A0ABS7DBP8_9BACL|nr:non-ribosomal peptide synthase/polyketide synthase [Paenibacillus oenotherae]MBW7477363.1 non-ribosomal peptide synthase/polyketide synthase [Paenibacillus oenotherae]
MSLSKQHYPLTHAQKRIWQVEAMYQGTAVANLAGLIKLDGTLDIDIFQKAANLLVSLNDSLRIQMKRTEEEEIEQYFAEDTEKVFELHDFSENGGEERAREWFEKQKRIPFALLDSPLYRISLVKIEERKFWIFVVVHHIVIDGISLNLIGNEFLAILEQLERGTFERPHKHSFLQHIENEERYLSSKRFSEDELFWNNQYSTIPEQVRLSASNPFLVSTTSRRITTIIPQEMRDRLKAFEQEYNSSIYNTFLAGLYLSLYRMTSIPDHTIGAFYSNRVNREERQMTGMFVSTVPFRMIIQPENNFLDFLKEVQKKARTILRHQKYPYDLLLNALREKQSGIERLFGVSILYQSFDWSEIASFFEQLFTEDETHDFIIKIHHYLHNDEIHINVDYRIEMFSENEITSFIEQMIEILNYVLKFPQHEIDIMTVAEKKQQLLGFNNTAASFPVDKTIHELFEEQVEKTPEQVALLFGAERVTYRELNNRVNRMAVTLRQKGVGPDRIVGIMAERSVEMIVGILSILKAGGAYLPLDSTHPDDRLAYMLQDANVSLLLIQPHLQDRLGSNGILYGGEVVLLLAQEAGDSGEAVENPAPLSTAADLAYVIYTSGSTGQPKGVAVEHRSVVNRLKWMQKRYPLTVDDVIMQKTPISFDVSVWELFWWAMEGASMCLLQPGEEKDPHAITGAIAEYRVTTMHFVPSMLNSFLGYLETRDNETGRLSSLRHVFASGEALGVIQAKRFYQRITTEHGAKLINLYGPTEATVDVTYFDCDASDDRSFIPIGKPIDNTRIYLLNEGMRLQPLGLIGEIYIAGEGVARGYLNNAELTAQKFVENPYKQGERMYRTGDLARWLPDGNIEYIGRMDHQVKIRGYRIELGEIESVLLEYPVIKEAVVTARKDDHEDHYMCAYVVSADHIQPAALREWLGNRLANYMIPSFFVQLEHMPLTPNGKLDRRALPAPEKGAAGAEVYVEPRTMLEAKLVELWSSVLDVNRIGVKDHFFERGGHSLKATKLIALMHKELKVTVPLKTIFQYPVLEEMASIVERLEREGYSEISTIEESAYYQVSSAQKRMYVLNQVDGSGLGYNMSGIFEITGHVDAERLEQAFAQLILRHESLRTSFLIVDGVPVQRVQADVNFKLHAEDCLHAVGESDIRERLQSFVRPFDLEQAPLLRVELLERSSDHHILMFDMHHIISDGVSIMRIIDEVSRFYAGESLPELRIQYKDYAAWQQKELESERMRRQEAYWLETFADEIPVLNLPTDYGRPALQSFDGGTVHAALAEEAMKGLRRIGAETGATLYMVLLAAFTAFLAKYSGQEDIVVGTPIAGRPHADLEPIIGMFVETLALRNYPRSDLTFLSYVKEVKQRTLEAFEHGDYPLEELIDKLNVQRDMSRNALFDVMFSLQHKEEAVERLVGLAIKPYPLEQATAKFDLTLHAEETEGDGLILGLEFATSLFTRETAERMLRHFLQLTAELAASPEKRIEEAGMLAEEERKELLLAACPVAAAPRADKTVSELFEEQAERTPARPAVRFGADSLTYLELNERSNRLARALQKRGVGPESIVAILVERSVEMVVSMLAVLKAGGAYLPIDPDYPQERIRFLLEDSAAKTVVTQPQLARLLEGSEAEQVIALEGDLLAEEESGNLPRAAGSDNLAYVIYTSGSTGQPKGVMIEHGNYTAMAYAWRSSYELDCFEVRALQMASFSFDVFAGDVARTLLWGGELVICPNEARSDLRALSELIDEHRITIMESTPALVMPLLRYREENGRGMGELRLLIIGSDTCPAGEFKKLVSSYGATLRILNSYGVTECCIDSSYYETGESPLKEGGNVPIGKPLPGVGMYVLNRGMELQPVGVMGELCIGGSGVGRGYWRRPELTAEKFVDHPYAAGERLYRTGDLARRLPDGNIEYLGRMDQQVKIRGYRIELGEIEESLQEQEQIREAVVTVREDAQGERYLCAYVTASDELDLTALRSRLSERLASYMIPSYFVMLEELPLTPNGKLDRRALPAPEEQASGTAPYVEPRTALEASLAAIWQSVLGVPRIGAKDHFFEKGGHSLKAAVLASRIHKELQINVPLRTIFQSPVLEQLAAAVLDYSGQKFVEITRVKESPYYPLSSAQKRMYMLNQLSEADAGYNITGAYTIEGELDRARLEQAFRKLIWRHESLRTSFHMVDGELVQKVHEEVDFRINIQSIDGTGQAEIRERQLMFIRPFDLSQAPLLRVELLRLSSDRHIIMFDTHHIVSDGLSIGLLIGEIGRLYNGEKLPELQLQYKDYAIWQRKLMDSEVMRNQERFWLGDFKGDMPVLELPTDFARPAIQRFEGDAVYFDIPQETDEGLRRIADMTDSTLYMVLLASYSILLAKYSGQEEVVIGTPVAGRPHADLESLLGLFVGTLPMRSYPTGTKRFIEYVREVKERVLQAFENQDYPFEELVDKLNVPSDLSRNPVFDAMFAFDNTGQGEPELTGLRLLPLRNAKEFAKFDLNLQLTQSAGGLNGRLLFSTALFRPTTAQQMVDRFLVLLAEAAKRSELPIKDMAWFSAEEKERLLGFPAMTRNYPLDKPVHQLFEEIAYRTPEGIALVMGEQRLTYSELNERANHLAHFLVSRRAERGDTIALYMEPSVEMIIALIGVMKAGCAYLPLDPEHRQQKRQLLMLQDSRARLLLTTRECGAELSFADQCEVVYVDEEAGMSADRPNHPAASDDLLYIIYTSGTTGKPKGVKVRHRNIVNYSSWLIEQAGLHKADKTALLSSYAFDLGYTGLFGSLLSGGELHLLAREQYADPSGLHRYISDHGLTYLKMTPSLFHMLASYEGGTEEHDLNNKLRLIVLGGEKVKTDDIERYASRHPHIRYINHYGPTETTVGCIAHPIPMEDWEAYKEQPVIGRPIANTRIFIVDESMNLQPIGVYGEIVVGGEGVTAGYEQQPLLDSGGFTQIKYSESPVYRTGDIGRYLPDGTIELSGRKDTQLKILGYRVELGEVEACIRKLPGISDAAVVGFDLDASPYLCGYYVSTETIESSEIRQMLALVLPSYMIPAFLMGVVSIPLTLNGKVDKSALPMPQGGGTDNTFVAPRTLLESRLADMWKSVLGIEQVSVKDHFFELGGHSLKATTLVARMFKELQVNMPLRTIFQAPTLEELAGKVANMARRHHTSIKPVEPKPYYPASSAQKRMYILNQLSGAKLSYNMPGYYLIEGALDVIRLEQAFHALIQRHESLRTSFDMMAGEPVQIVKDDVQFAIEFEDLYVADWDTIEARLRCFVDEFSLEEAPLLRVGLLRLAANRHILMFDMHHIITDGVSIALMLKELNSLYIGEELPRLALQYKDYAVWQRRLEDSHAMLEQEAYWKGIFSGELPTLELPTDYPRPAVLSFEGSTMSFTLDEEIVTGLRRISRQTGATLYMVLFSLFSILLSKYAGQDDIVVGTPVAGRPHADLESMIGMFVGTLAIRSCPSEEKTFIDYLGEVKELTLQAYENQDYPFERLVDKLNVQNDMGRNPLFDVMFVMQDRSTATELGALQVTPYYSADRTAKFDLTLSVAEQDDQLRLSIEYRTSLFQKQTIERMAGHLCQLIAEAVSRPEQQLRELEMLTEQERMQVLYDFNDTAAGYPEEQTIHSLFEEQAANRPDYVAVAFGESRMIYRELNARANRIARTLRNQGVRRNDIVGLMTDRSVEMIAGILGILKAGGAYMPIDPDYPVDRIEYMLSDSGASVLVTDNGDWLATSTGKFKGITLDIRHIWIDEQIEAEDVERVNTSDDLAYVIYTSGTTGLPKGVLIEHRNVVRLLFNDRTLFDFGAHDVWTLFHSYCFDFSVWEMYGALLNGGKLVIIPTLTARDARAYLKLLEDEQVTIVNQTPSAFYQLATEALHLKPELRIRKVIFGGEALEPLQLLAFNDAYPNLRLINMYGITETTVHVTCKELAREDLELGRSNIGQPIPTLQAYVLSKDMKVLPIGVPGELYIGGDGVGRGYLNREELTAERFVANPFIEGGRMYRTGDLARWTADSSLEYMGRLDQQVKIRGYRIELGDIESQLLRINGINETAVLARKDDNGHSYLCAYLAAEASVDANALRHELSSRLPGYMIPSFFVQVARMPITSNGKLDRKALLAIEGEILTAAPYLAPRTEMEIRLASLWSGVLGIDKIGAKDNFFERGGHSLTAATLAARMHKELNINVPLRTIFHHPTLEGLAEALEQLDFQRFTGLKQAEEMSHYPVTGEQRRLYILSQLGETELAYNMPVQYSIEGPFEREKVERTIRQLIVRHQILRTSFELVDGEPVQRIHDQVPFELEFERLLSGTEEDFTRYAKAFVRPFDLSAAPLLRVGLLELGPERHMLLFDMHHIISDGVSMSVLAQEFTRLYAGETLAEPGLQYKDYAVWQRKWMDGEGMRKQEAYWLAQFAGEIPTMELTVDYRRPLARTFEGEFLDIEIDRALTAKLHRLASDTGSTLYMLLLTAFTVLLSKYSGQEDIIVGTPVAGRRHADLEQMLGMFVGTLALRNYPSRNKPFLDYVREVKERTLEAFEHQNYPFEKLVEQIDVGKDLSRNPLFDTMFIMQNIEQASIELGGLKLTSIEPAHQFAKFDLTLIASEHEQKLMLRFQYRTSLFAKQTIERMAGHMNQLLCQAAERPELHLSSLELMTASERKIILDQFNYTAAAYPSGKTIHELFEEQVERTPDQIAVVFGQSHLTYRELNALANRMAENLRTRGAGPEQVVGLLAERSLEMVVSTLAVLKAGAAFLPIDPAYPQERIRFMIEDAAIRLVLVQPHLNSYDVDADFVEITLERNAASMAGAGNLTTVSGPDNAAYIIYTSGSTGTPKGVVVEHRSLVNLSVWHGQFFKVSPVDRIAKYASDAFDASVWELFPYLIAGASVYIVPQEIRLDIEALHQFYAVNQITIAWLPPQMYELLADTENESLRLLLTGSDKVKLYKPVSYEVWNTYGPTECTVISTAYRLADEVRRSIPIGKPLANTKIYIVDEQMNLMPIGVPGELCIAGDGVARGYWNRPELTAERFVRDPFSEEGRMYRTGDLARWLPDGNIEYLGRIDEQVKIRGYRIELGEIEAQLLQVREIKEAIVSTRQDDNGESYLCAYFVAHAALDIAKLRSWLSDRLPGYMQPSFFVQLAQLPLTPNGKVDRRGLPAPEQSRLNETFALPRTVTEVKLAEIWRSILGIEQLGRDDSFFDLGGHSLKAAMLVARLNKELHVSLPLRSVFEAPSLSAMSKRIESLEESSYTAIERTALSGNYSLSSAQKRMYILDQLEGAQTSYNMPAVYIIDGMLDIQRMESALQEIINRHESMRTFFVLENGIPVQRVQENIQFKLSIVEGAETGDAADAVLKGFVRPFDLGQAPLFRSGVSRLSDGRYLFFFDIHHIVSDGISMGVLLDEFERLYAGESLPELRIQYKDYAAWQQKELESERMRRQEAYWLETFADEIPVLNLPTDYGRPALQSFDGGTVHAALAEEAMKGLRRIGAETGATLYMVLLAAFTAFLAKYSGQEDIVVGTPIAGRPHADLEPIIGMFVETLALRNYPRSDLTFLSYVKEVKQRTLEAFEHGDYPLEELIDKLNVQRDMSRNALFDVMFSLQHKEEAVERLVGLAIKPYPLEQATAKFDLTLHAEETEGDGLILGLEFATSLFTRETAERMLRHFLQLTAELAASPEKRIEEAGMLAEEERKELLLAACPVAAAPRADKTVSELFEEQAERTPARPAVRFGADSLTYLELNERSNRLARALQKRGVGPESIVAILVERSVEMVVSMLAVLKAGGAYLPIDPDYPQERIRFLLEDSAAKTVVTQPQLARLLEGSEAEQVIALEGDLLAEEESGNLPRAAGSDNLAYVIYTSGSTGQPKGVMIEHGNYTAMAYAWRSSYELDCFEVRALQMASFSFDVFAGDVARTLLWGGELVICPNEARSDLRALSELIDEHRITIMESTPALVMPLLRYREENGRGMGELRLLIIGSDTCPAGEFKKLVSSYGATLRILNSYGVTECCIDSSYYETGESPLKEGGNVPIGKPLPGVGMYVLNRGMELQPVGVMGELCIGGSGVGRGYWRRPELTAEKFVDHPYAAGERLYRTGDLARRLPDGNIEYLGRMDQQVKIRGYRIELGEIEESLQEQEQIREAVVTVREDAQGERYLCAYVTASDELDLTALRSRLSERLASYMIPSYFVMLEELPLTPNGKLDRRALPAPEEQASGTAPYVEPRTALEASLAAIWQSVLGVPRIGAKDHFFEKGGHSLKAAVLASRIHKELHVSLPLRSVFEVPILEEMSERIAGLKQERYQMIQPVEERDYYPVTSAQKRMYLMNLTEGESSLRYNMPAIFTIEGGIDKELLKNVMRQLIDRHESLRTSFHMVKGELVQMVHKQVKFHLMEIEATETDLERHIRSCIRSFDVHEAPLLRVALIEVSETKHTLIFDTHHIVSDGVSMDVLLEEFARLYAGEELPESLIQYKDFAVWQQERLGQGSLNNSEDYWLNVYAEPIKQLELITDFPRTDVSQSVSGVHYFNLDSRVLDKLRRIAALTGSTMYMVLLSAYSIQLSKYSGQNDIVIGSPSEGRTYAGLERVVGMFVNTLAMRVHPQSDLSFYDYLVDTRKRTLDAIEHQEYPFEWLVEKLDLVREHNRNPLFDTMFVWQTELEQSLQLDQLKLIPWEGDTEKSSKFDLSFIITEKAEGDPVCCFEYSTMLFKHQTIEQFAADFMEILEQIGAEPYICLQDIELSQAGTTFIRNGFAEVDFIF